MDEDKSYLLSEIGVEVNELVLKLRKFQKKNEKFAYLIKFNR